MKILIRPLIEADVSRLDLGPLYKWPGLHRFKIQQQEAEESVYLGIFNDLEPIGHLEITWAGAPSPPLPFPVENCPDISDVAIASAHRRKGYAQLLMAEAENLISQRGFRQVGLGVAVDNDAALALYEKLGYVRCDMPEFYERGEWRDGHGVVRRWGERCIYLVHDLSSRDSA